MEIFLRNFWLNRSQIVTALLVLYITVSPVVAIIYRNVPAAVVLVTAGTVAVFLTRLDRLTELSVYGLRVRLQKALDEANATIAQLRALGKSLARPILNELAMSDVPLAGRPFEDQYADKKAIMDSLSTLGLSRREIKEVSELWTHVTTRKLSNYIAGRIQDLSAELREEVLRTRVEGQPMRPAAFANLIKRNNITDAEVLALVEDYKLLWKTGEMQNPAALPFSVQP